MKVPFIGTTLLACEDGEHARRLASHFIRRGVWFFYGPDEGEHYFAIDATSPAGTCPDLIRRATHVDFRVEGEEAPSLLN
jgi:hypothetical protein